jgi:hypothetical protein
MDMEAIEDLLENPEDYSLVEMLVDAIDENGGIDVSEVTKQIMEETYPGLSQILDEKGLDNFAAQELEKMGAVTAKAALDNGILDANETISILAEIGNAKHDGTAIDPLNYEDAYKLAEKYGFSDQETVNGLAAIESQFESAIDGAAALIGGSDFNSMFNLKSLAAPEATGPSFNNEEFKQDATPLVQP